MRDEQIALLKAYRAHHGWTQVEAARELGVAFDTWTGWEGGKPMPQQPFVLRLLRETLAAQVGPQPNNA